MAKFVETEYGSTKEILKFPDHYVGLAVMVDDDVAADPATGKKIVKKGTLVGGKTKSVLDNLDEPVSDKYVLPIAAKKTFGTPGQNSAITLTAVTPGVAGNSISLTITDPAQASKQLAVSVGGSGNKDITVSLGTDGTGAENSTAEEVAEAINTHTTAKTLVVATAHGDGEGVVAASAKTNLEDGADSSVTGVEGVLMNDVDVTHGDNSGTMLIHAYIATDKLPYGANNADAASKAGAVLHMVKFIK